MKYYEQLLESFDKLKKRTFKLTVLEQGRGHYQRKRGGKKVTGRDPALRQQKQADAKATQTALKQFEGLGPSNFNGHTVEVYQNKEKPPKIIVAAEELGRVGSIDLYGKQWNTIPLGQQAEILVSWFKGKGAGGGTTTQRVDLHSRDMERPLAETATVAWVKQNPVEEGEDGHFAWKNLLELAKLADNPDIDEDQKRLIQSRIRILQKFIIDGFFGKVRQAWFDICEKFRKSTDSGRGINRLASLRKPGKGGILDRGDQGCQLLSNYFAGGMRASFEQQFGPNTFEPDIEIGDITDLTNFELGAGIQKLKEFMDLLKGVLEIDKNPTPDQDSQISDLRGMLSDFLIMPDDSIRIAVGGTDAEFGGGFILQDEGGVYRAMLLEARDLYNEHKGNDVEEFGFPSFETTLKDSQVGTERGSVMELLTINRQLRRNCQAITLRIARIEGDVRTPNKSKDRLAELKSLKELVCPASDSVAHHFIKHGKGGMMKLHPWALKVQNGEIMLPVDDWPAYAALKEHGLMGENLKKILTAFDVLAERGDGPLMAELTIPAGDIAKKLNKSDKDDSIHLWKPNCPGEEKKTVENCCAKAIQGVMDSRGFDEKEATLSVEYLPKGLEDPLLGPVVKGLEKFKDPASNSGSPVLDYVNHVFNKDSVCVFRNGIKNDVQKYDSPEVIGVTKDNYAALQGYSRADFMPDAETGEGGTPDGMRILEKALRFTGFLEDDQTIDKRKLKQGNPEYDPNLKYVDPKTLDYWKDWDKYVFSQEKLIDDLATKFTVKDDNGNETEYDALEAHILALVQGGEVKSIVKDSKGRVTTKTLERAADYKSKQSKDELDELVTKRGTLKKEIKDKLKTESGRKELIAMVKKYRMREMVMPHIHNTLFNKDGTVRFDDQKAMRLLRSMLVGDYTNGASLHDSTSLDGHALDDGQGGTESLSVRHNQIYDFKKAALEPGGIFKFTNDKGEEDQIEVEVVRGENSIIFRDKNDHSVNVSYAMSRDTGSRPKATAKQKAAGIKPPRSNPASPTKWRSEASRGWMRRVGKRYGESSPRSKARLKKDPEKAKLFASKDSLITQYLDQQKKLFDLLLS